MRYNAISLLKFAQPQPISRYSSFSYSRHNLDWKL